MPLCSISEDGCEQPTGWPTLHGAVFNPNPGTLDTYCAHCGGAICTPCSGSVDTGAHAGERWCARCLRAEMAEAR